VKVEKEAVRKGRPWNNPKKREKDLAGEGEREGNLLSMIFPSRVKKNEKK
jgi:hypothetical protein